MFTIESVKALAKEHGLRVFFFWPEYTEGDEIPKPTSIQVAFHTSVNSELWLQMVTQPCEIPLETRGYRDANLNIRPEYREAFVKARATGRVPPALHNDIF